MVSKHHFNKKGPKRYHWGKNRHMKRDCRPLGRDTKSNYRKNFSKGKDYTCSGYMWLFSGYVTLQFVVSECVCVSSRPYFTVLLSRLVPPQIQHKFYKHVNKWNMTIRGLKAFESQGLRARLCCRKISDSIFWLHCFTPRWLAGAIPCPKKVPKEIYKKKR